jgi:hypothetical protein
MFDSRICGPTLQLTGVFLATINGAVCRGGDPEGLSLAISMKLQAPFRKGVVFTDHVAKTRAVKFRCFRLREEPNIGHKWRMLP